MIRTIFNGAIENARLDSAAPECRGRVDNARLIDLNRSLLFLLWPIHVHVSVNELENLAVVLQSMLTKF